MYIASFSPCVFARELCALILLWMTVRIFVSLCAFVSVSIYLHIYLYMVFPGHFIMLAKAEGDGFLEVPSPHSDGFTSVAGVNKRP